MNAIYNNSNRGICYSTKRYIIIIIIMNAVCNSKERYYIIAMNATYNSNERFIIM